MRPAVLVVACQSLTLLGLAQALLKFGYQLITAYPDETELKRAGKVHPALVVLRPPLEEEERRTCLDAVKKHFRDRGIPVLTCVSIPEEADSVRAVLGEVPVLTGSPIRLNDLYARIQEMFKVARRKDLRITAELVVAHREPVTRRLLHQDGDPLSGRLEDRAGVLRRHGIGKPQGDRNGSAAWTGSGRRGGHGCQIRIDVERDGGPPRIVPDEPPRHDGAPRQHLNRISQSPPGRI
jgi:hypothetical protein